MKIDCSEASTLTSASYDRKLTAGEIVRLAIHRLICGPCRLYKKQLETMRRCATRLAGNDEPPLETLGCNGGINHITAIVSKPRYQALSMECYCWSISKSML